MKLFEKVDVVEKFINGLGRDRGLEFVWVVMEIGRVLVFR